ncbi:MAG: prepilin-type N-terminal cleavage/methylation domain-containing protein [bacterium]
MPFSQSKTPRGFTLIELLIVVAIIAILAAIAIPNFLAAQTRSKVSRTQAEQKTIATALESYYVDNNEYALYNNPMDDPTEDEYVVPVGLTTPIAYITSLPMDVFNYPSGTHGKPVHPFHYAYEPAAEGEVALKYEEYYLQSAGAGLSRKWIIWSHAPDIDCDEGAGQYDPTNGTISNGDIARFGP